MRIAIFFICLVFLLPGGVFHVSKNICHHSIYSPLNIKIADRFKYTGTDKDHTSIANNNMASEEMWFDCEDVDEEDSSEVAPRKFIAPAGIHSINYFLASLSYHRDFPKVLPSIWDQSSSRYILLRSFRV